MYLEILNDKEKELFLSLAYNLSAVDNDYSPEERELMASYCNEMNVNFEMDKINLSVDDVIDEINNVCSDEVKRIILFAMIRLAMVDRDYDPDERRILRSAVEKFGFDMEFHDNCESLLGEYMQIKDRIYELLSD